MHQSDQTPERNRWRIAFVVTELEPGGAERCLTELAVQLDRQWFDVAVWSLAPAPRRTLLVERLAMAAVPVTFLGLRHWWHVPKVAFHLRQQLIHRRVDLVQSFLHHSNILASIVAPCPVVWGIRVAEPRRFRQRCERWLAHRAAAIVCVSQDVRRYMVDSVGIPQSSLQVIPNGIDVDRLQKKAAAASVSIEVGAAPYLLFVGRLDLQKGIDWLAKLTGPLLSSLPQHRLVLIGEGPWHNRFLDHVDDRVRSRVHLLGWRTDVAAWMKHADLLLLPSRWEGMPNVVLEAMAVGCPVLATEAHGLNELLGPMASHQCVPFGQTQQFVRRALDMIENSTVRQQVIQSNRRQVERNFSLPQMVQQYEILYRDILGRKSIHRP